MGKYELTQEEYVAVMGSNPSYFRNGTAVWDGGTGDGVRNDLRHPVETVTWDDAANYCARLTERERVAGRLPAGWGYRLPTEAEWEYACRSGTTSAFHYGPALRSGMENFYGLEEYDSSVGTTRTNAAGIYLGRTTVVGSYEANGWGLYDMHGNVSEWCVNWDQWWLHPSRGGNWAASATNCRSALSFYIEALPAGGAGSIHGFRVVLDPGQ
jgi:formylglycine-generating enzyme required for sulfatase activity